MPAGPHAQPLVTLGVPVRDGAAHLDRALRSLQAQTYPQLEILISDNASTDGTEALCRRIAAGDSRVRYLRQVADIGAARNFELVAREARGELVAWCAHDDERSPRFVEACVAELHRRPEAVLCNGAVAYLDEEGAVRPDWADLNFETLGLERPARAARLLDHTHWVEMYGLIRREALLQTLPIEPVWGSDVLLSMKLLMLGDFAKVPEVLFRYRVRTRHKGAARTMRELVHARRGPRCPYTDMVQQLIRVPMARAESREEQAAVLWSFLRTLCEHRRAGPHASWREILVSDQWDRLGPPVAPETLGRHLLAWLAEGLPGALAGRGREAMALALLGARRVLVACAARDTAETLEPLLRELRVRCPGADLGLLAPGVVARRLEGVAGASLVFPCSPERSDPGGPEAERVRRWRPDLAVCLDPDRPHGIDDLAATTGALLGIAAAQGEAPGRPGWPPGLGAAPADRRWGFLLPRGAGLPGLLAVLDRADPRDLPAPGAARRLRRAVGAMAARGRIAWHDATFVAMGRYPRLYAAYRRVRRLR